MKARIALPPKLIPVFAGEADVRGAHGGRGSGKTRSFAKMTAVRALIWAQAGRKGIVLCGRRFMNSLADSSLEEIKAAIREEPLLTPHFDIGEKYVRTADGRVSYAFSGLDRNIDSVKSKSRILLCWVDEAEPVSDEAWTKLIPTLREEDSELWVTWNPESKRSATHRRFRLSADPRYRVAELNWRDNPRFPAILERQRQRDLIERPDQYDHIWEGGFVKAVEGAYYAGALDAARAAGRIGHVARDPLMAVRAFWDIGGTGAKADACAIWIAQFVGREIRVLDHYEAVGQELGEHVGWLRRRGYGDALCVLPHDGATRDRVYRVSYQSALADAGFAVEVVPNQGAGAAAMRIEAARRLFPSIWFDEAATEAGREALAWYHEKRDDKREIGLGPKHDWSSHACFTGDTLLLTRYGMRRIDSLEKTAEILTPCGWKQYILPRMTKRAAPLVEVEFVGGHMVRCTPDHLFLTGSGWKSAEDLQPGSLIQSSLTLSRSISMAAFTVFGLAKHIIRAAGKSFIATFGQPRSAKFPKVATFIIVMATRRTTLCGIWNAWTPANIFRTHGTQPKGSGPQALIRLPEMRLQSGTDQRLDGSGTSVTPNGAKAGPNGNASHGHASIAVRSSSVSSARTAISRNIAASIARWRPIVSAVGSANMRLRIASVKRLSETADVWDITVPEVHCFSLANGAVVHNSDAFGLMCVAYEMPRDRKDKPRRHAGAGIEGGWMGL